jgi:hypothetical protein
MKQESNTRHMLFKNPTLISDYRPELPWSRAISLRLQHPTVLARGVLRKNGFGLGMSSKPV